MVGLRRAKTMLFVALVLMATIIADGAKPLKESNAPAAAPTGSKIAEEVKGAAKKVKDTAAPVGDKVAEGVKGAAEKVKETAAPIGGKLGLKGSGAPADAPVGATGGATGAATGATAPAGSKAGGAAAKGGGKSLDVKASGAKGDGKTDDSAAFMAVWKEACAAASPSTITVPKGEYFVNNLEFKGPCKGPITLEMNGNLKAPSAASKDKTHCGWIEIEKLENFVLNGNGAVFDGQGAIAWKVNDCQKTGKCNNLPVNIRFTSLTNSKITGINSTNSKLFHINIHQCKNTIFQDINIDAPAESLNTDGIHIGKSSGVTLTGSRIRTGDDCISIGDGTENLLVENTECGPGHGISIGSLGKYPNELPVKGVTIRKCLIKNTDNGVRIKTWPGSPPGIVSDVLYDDITMDNVTTPILIDQVYCPHGKCKKGAPSQVKLSGITYRNIKGTSASKVAVKLLCSPGAPCTNVVLADINLVHNGKEGPAVSACSDVKPVVNGKSVPPACSEIAKADV